MNNSGQSVRSDVSVSDTAAIDLAATACARYSAAFASFGSFMSAFETDSSFKSNMAEILQRIIRFLGLLLIGSHAWAKPNMLPFTAAPAATADISVDRVAKDYIIYK